MDQQRPKNYLVPAILATIACCIATGIVSIIYSTQVNSKYEAGDIQGAEKASKTAKTWLIVSIVIGLLGWIIGVIIPTLFLGSSIMEIIQQGGY
jgi:hypothetical protein